MVVASSPSPKSKVKKTKLIGGESDKMSGVLQRKQNSTVALREDKVRNVAPMTNTKLGKGKLKASGVMQKKLKSTDKLKSVASTKVGKGKLKTGGVMQKTLKSANKLKSVTRKEVLNSQGENIVARKGRIKTNPIKPRLIQSTSEPDNVSKKDIGGNIESAKNDKVGKEKVRVVQAKRKSTDEYHDSSKIQKVVNVKGKKFVKVGERKHSKGDMFFQMLKKRMGISEDIEEEKPNWKEARKLSLKLKEERKKKKITHYDIIVKAKKLWEDARHGSCHIESRAKLIAALYQLLEDHLTEFVFKHDTSRIVQWLLKEGTPLIRLSITKILRREIKEMLLKKFSRCCVKNMLKYGDEECRRIVFSEINMYVVKLMSSIVSAPIVEFAYSSWSTPEEKLLFKREFYGNMLKLMSDAEVSSLKDALSLKEVTKDVLVDTKANILQVVSKRVPVSQLMHSIILEYLKLCEEADRNDIIDILYPHCKELVQTREGAEIAMICCWFTCGKVKKIILKSLRGEVKEVCSLPYGHWFLMALLDSVDDTVLLGKTLLSDLVTNVVELLSLDNGRKVITYLVAHRNSAYFHPVLISLLKTADSSTFVKKDMDTKWREILEIIMKPLANVISNDVTPWFQNAACAMVLMSVLIAGKGDTMMDAYHAVASYICQDIKVPHEDKNVALVEHGSFHYVIRKIIKNETDEESHATLSYQLAEHLTEEVIWRWMDSNRGCFVLLFILESKNKAASQVLMEKLTVEMKKRFRKASSLGANFMKRKLADSENK